MNMTPETAFLILVVIAPICIVAIAIAYVWIKRITIPRSPFGKPIKPLGRDDPGGRYYDVAVKSLNIANHVGHELTLRRRQDGKVELICMSDGPYNDPVKAVFVPQARIPPPTQSL